MAELAQMYGNALKDNLLPRLSLLRTALTRRFIYADVVQMARNYGLEYHDITGDVEPFEFIRAVLRRDGTDPPDFSVLEKDAGLFSIEGIPNCTNSEPSVARFLGKLVYHLGAREIVELGSFSGWTSAHIALALRSRGNVGRLSCVEMHDTHLAAVSRNLARYGLNDCVRLLRGMSLDKEVFDQLPELIDILFLDTSHTYPATRDEILAYLPRLAPSGCFVLHDSISAVGVRRSLAEIPIELRRLSFATEYGNGVTVLVRTGFFKDKQNEK